MQPQKEEVPVSDHSKRKKSVVIGATPNPSRYAYMAVSSLQRHDHPVVPLGIRKGTIGGDEIVDLRSKPKIEGVHSVTLYINPGNQEAWEDYILQLNPSRIIFNPGTENPRLKARAMEKNIETIEACTLVLLSTDQY